eukprot:Opistho-2@5283
MRDEASEDGDSTPHTSPAVASLELIPPQRMASSIPDNILPKDIRSVVRSASPAVLRSVSIQRVRRNLFGCVNENEMLSDLMRDSDREVMEKSDAYNFDFVAGRPRAVQGTRYDWSVCAGTTDARRISVGITPCFSESTTTSSEQQDVVIMGFATPRPRTLKRLQRSPRHIQ